MPVLRRDRLGRPVPSGTPGAATLRLEPFSGSAAEAFAEGVRRFDERRFFEAHELFEHVWRSPEIDAADRELWKGVTQVAVGCCHVQRGNARGAAALLERAAGHLGVFPSPHRGVDTSALARAARTIAETVRTRGTGAAADAFVAFPLARGDAR